MALTESEDGIIARTKLGGVQTLKKENNSAADGSTLRITVLTLGSAVMKMTEQLFAMISSAEWYTTAKKINQNNFISKRIGYQKIFLLISLFSLFQA